MDVNNISNGTDSSIVDDNDNLSERTNTTDKEQYENNITKTNTNTNINVYKLLEHKGDQQTNKKQSPLEEALARYEKQLDNKSLEDLEKEKEKLELNSKDEIALTMIAIMAILALLIVAAILLPLITSLAIVIPCVLSSIALFIMCIYDNKRIKKMIDIVNAKIAKKKLQITPYGNKKNQYINNGQSNNKSISEKKINNNNINKSNNTPKDKDEKNNINNNQNIQQKNTSKINDKAIISNNILANKNNNINTNTLNKASNISKNITQQVNKSIQKIPQLKSVNNNEQSDKQKAEEINQNTLTKILQGTLDLSSRPKSKEEYEKCQKELKDTKTQVAKAMLQQQMIKYEIWSQLSPESQKIYEKSTKKGKSPEGILKDNAKNNANWQVILYSKHLENEEQKNQSWLSTINPVNWNVFKNEKSIEEKQQAVKRAIFSEPQQQKNMQISGVGTQKENYNSGAIKNENMKTQVNQKF